MSGIEASQQLTQSVTCGGRDPTTGTRGINGAGTVESCRFVVMNLIDTEPLSDMEQRSLVRSHPWLNNPRPVAALTKHGWHELKELILGILGANVNVLPPRATIVL